MFLIKSMPKVWVWFDHSYILLICYETRPAFDKLFVFDWLSPELISPTDNSFGIIYSILERHVLLKRNVKDNKLPSLFVFSR